MAAQTITVAPGGQSSSDQQFYDFVALQLTESFYPGAQNTFSFTTLSEFDGEKYAEIKQSIENILGRPVHVNMDIYNHTVTLAHGEELSPTSTQEVTAPQESEVSVHAVPEKPKKKVPRPPNPFIIYRKDQHAQIVAQNPGMHNNDISIIIGRKWKNESTEIKLLYQRKAAEAKRQHQLAHPGYQYQPRKPSEKKKRMTKNKLAKINAAKANGTANRLENQLPLPNGDLRIVPPTPIVAPAPIFADPPVLNTFDAPQYGQMGNFTAGDDVNGDFAAQLEEYNDTQKNACTEGGPSVLTLISQDVAQVEGIQYAPMPTAPLGRLSYPVDEYGNFNWAGNGYPTIDEWDFSTAAQDFLPDLADFADAEFEREPAFVAEVGRQERIDEEANKNIEAFFDFESFQSH